MNCLELLWKFQVLHTNAIPWKFQVHASRILCIPWNLHGHTPRILCLKFKLFLFCHDLDLQIKRNAWHNWMTWHLKSDWVSLSIMMQKCIKCFCFLANNFHESYGMRISWGVSLFGVIILCARLFFLIKKAKVALWKNRNHNFALAQTFFVFLYW